MIDFIAKPPKKKKEKKLLADVEAELRSNGTEYRVFYTTHKGGGKEIAEELTQSGESTVVVVGGDGTLNDVLTGIQDPSRCVLGLIPAGTGNDFAASANIPKGLAALKLILSGETKPTDYIAFSDGRRSLNIAGLGMDVDILTRCERMKRLHAKSKYFFSLLASLIKYRGCEIEVTVDGETRTHNALIAAVCNGKQLGGGIPLCPPAEIADGKMDLTVVDCPKRSKLLGALIKLMRGKVLALPFTCHTLCESAVIKPSARCIAQYDGELYETDALEATLVHGQLNMFRG